MIEQVARAGAEQLRAATTADAGAGLADLHARQATRRRRTRIGGVAAVVLALGIGWGAGSMVTGRLDDRPALPTHPVPPSRIGNLACQAPLVDCRPGRTFRFDLVRPVVWKIPRGFGVSSGSGATTTMVESYRSAGPTAGVTVMERVRAASPNGVRPAPGVADDPRAFVDWVAGRPFLDAGQVVRTRIDGYDAWQVRVTRAHGAGPGRASCSGHPCHLVTYQPGGGTTGFLPGMAAEYTAFRLPGAGTTVVWSWVFTGDTRDLAGMDEAVRGLSWRTG